MTEKITFPSDSTRAELYSFLPSGLIQWVLFAIVILWIIIIVRKVFGVRKNYEESPMIKGGEKWKEPARPKPVIYPKDDTDIPF